MKKSPKTKEDCIDSIQATADRLLKEGATSASVMAALVQVIVGIAKKDRNPAASLDIAASILLSAADRIFERAKKAALATIRRKKGKH